MDVFGGLWPLTAAQAVSSCLYANVVLNRDILKLSPQGPGDDGAGQRAAGLLHGAAVGDAGGGAGAERARAQDLPPPGHHALHHLEARHRRIPDKGEPATCTSSSVVNDAIYFLFRTGPGAVSRGGRT